MKKKLLMAAAIAFAVFAIPYGSNALSTVSVASGNNTVASENNTVASGNNTVATPTPAPTPSTKPSADVKNAVDAIDASKITNRPAATEARQSLINIGSADLKNAMNSDSSIIDKIAKIEKAYKYIISGGNAGQLNSADTAIENKTEVEAVNVIGGSFFGPAKLEMSTPDTKPAITASNYVVSGTPVYVDITFIPMKKGYYTDPKHEFEIPIAISVKVPAGIDGSKAVIFHFADSGLEAINPIYDSAANTLTFAVNELSTFAIAETKTEVKTDDSTATAGSCGGTDDVFGRYRENLASEIANAKDGTTVKISRDKNINALPNDIMKALYKKQTVALELEYTFQGKEYTVTIPAGKAEDNTIEWYGPLYLQMRYGK